MGYKVCNVGGKKYVTKYLYPESFMLWVKCKTKWADWCGVVGEAEVAEGSVWHEAGEDGKVGVWDMQLDLNVVLSHPVPLGGILLWGWETKTEEATRCTGIEGMGIWLATPLPLVPDAVPQGQ